MPGDFQARLSFKSRLGEEYLLLRSLAREDPPMMLRAALALVLIVALGLEVSGRRGMGARLLPWIWFAATPPWVRCPWNPHQPEC